MCLGGSGGLLVALQLKVAGAFWLGNHCPMDHPGHITLESLVLACCMWSHMGQQSDETAGEPA